ncbi:MAG: hypothetical protein SGI87_11430 [Flavobacteriales bacterium]|nr:hypothetical protein [Flavobacteriales bacterium]
MKGIFVYIVVVIVSTSSAMAQEGRQFGDIYTPGTFRNRGWFFAPGITYMIPSKFNRDETRISHSEQLNDTLFTGEFQQRGKIGLYAEVGRHYFLKDLYLIHHLDFGIHVKNLRGTEDFNGRVRVDSVMMSTENRGYFGEVFAGAFFNVSHITQLSDKTWIQNGIGLNADYRVISNRDYEGPTTGMVQNFPNAFVGQLHYKLGFGWKPENGVYIVPSIETPILTLYPMDDGKSTLQYFFSRYRPIIVTIRICFLDKAEDRECQPLDLRGSKPQLWDKDMRKKKRYGRG